MRGLEVVLREDQTLRVSVQKGASVTPIDGLQVLSKLNEGRTFLLVAEAAHSAAWHRALTMPLSNGIRAGRHHHTLTLPPPTRVLSQGGRSVPHHATAQRLCGLRGTTVHSSCHRPASTHARRLDLCHVRHLPSAC